MDDAQMRQAIVDAVAAMRSAPRLQLAIWYAVHGPDVSPESTLDYRLYETVRVLADIADALDGGTDGN